jgi:hypothetical protein
MVDLAETSCCHEAGENSFVLDEDLSPQRASLLARAAGALAARLQVHANLELPAEKFFTIEGMVPLGSQ